MTTASASFRCYPGAYAARADRFNAERNMQAEAARKRLLTRAKDLAYAIRVATIERLMESLPEQQRWNLNERLQSAVMTADGRVEVAISWEGRPLFSSVYGTVRGLADVYAPHEALRLATKVLALVKQQKPVGYSSDRGWNWAQEASRPVMVESADLALAR